MALSPTERTMRARIGGLRLHALHDTRHVSAPGRAAAAVNLETKLLAQVDPDGQLDPVERGRRLERARKAHFAQLAYRSARARSERKAVEREQATKTAPVSEMSEAVVLGVRHDRANPAE